MVGSQLAFVDSTGNPSMALDKEGTSTFFIVVTVLVDVGGVESVRAAAEDLRRRHFQTGEMKSEKVAGNANRRLRILKDLAGLEFRYHAFIVDKREIDPESGLIYKEPFIKFLHRQVYQRLFSCFPDIVVVADSYGDREFMDGFKRYVDRLTEPTLFRRSHFEFRESHTDPLVQVADFLAGSFGAALEPSKGTVAFDDVVAALEARRALIEAWPIKRRPLGAVVLSSDSGADRLVRDHCLNQAYAFVEGHHDSPDLGRMHQVRTMRYLLDHVDDGANRGYLPTGRLIDHLAALNPEPVSIYFFRSEVIAKLRDSGVILASSSQGYKIPTSVADVASFVDHDQSIVEPLLGRLKAARDQLLLASKGDLDIVGDDRYLRLRRMLQTLDPGP